MGNTFTVSNAVTVCGANAPGSGGNCSAHWWSLDDQTVASVNVAPPVMPGTLPSSADLKRTVLELGSVCGSSIQSCITYACTNLSGQRPIVHLPVGNYSVGSTITIPANCDVQLVGDGYNTALTWAGGSGPMIQADGPSKATLKDLMMWNGTTAINLANADQPGSRMYAVGMRIENTEAIVTDNLQNTAVDFINEQGGQPWNTSKPTVAVNGAGAGVGSSYVGFWGHMHGGGQGGSMYSVTNGGQLYAIDAWDEVGYQTTVAASGGANFTGSGIHWPPGPDGAPAGGDWISMSGVNGNIAMLGSRISNSGSYRGIRVNSELSTSNGIFLGNYNDVFNAGTFFNRTAPGSGNFLFQGNTGGDIYGSSNAVEVATPSSASMARTALAGYRNTWPKPLSSNGSGVTDFRIFRVYISGGAMGIHVSR
jgi:hypothetical protein